LCSEAIARNVARKLDMGGWKGGPERPDRIARIGAATTGPLSRDP